jgi:adenine/guanine phosphoribosyltransferase-like PRPP-binding protein
LRRDIVAVFDADGSRPGLPALDLADFSRFKHGAADATWRLGRRIAANLPAGVTLADRLVVTASCYKFVPLASVALAAVVAHRLNRARADAGLEPVVRTQFYREQLIEGDYSTMTLAEREAFIARDVIRVDAETLVGAAVLVVDDLRVTGFHEGRLAAVLEAAGVPAATFAYCAVIDGTGDPTVERRMNTASIGGLDALAEVAAGDGFILNSRVCKLILGAPEAEFARFVEVAPEALRRRLVTALECNGYAVMGRYRRAYETLVAA